MIATKDEFNYLFVINHFKDEVIGSHQIPGDYNLKPSIVNICMSTDMGKTTQKFQVLKTYDEFYIIDEYTIKFNEEDILIDLIA